MKFRPLILSIALFPAVAMAQGSCGSLTNAYGPFDYRTGKARLAIVEAYHFTPDVETLRSGATGTLGGDLDYTLRASPNHHRALNSMTNLALREHKAKPRGAHFTIDCYFERARQFAPDDGTVLIIEGVYLDRIGRKSDAVRVLEEAKKFEPTNANLYYNLGLAYFDIKDYAKSLENAQRAYRLGAVLPGLRNKLQGVKQWREPGADDSAAVTSPPAPRQ
jgi:Flp pilus assembly protein TadD